MGRAFVAQNDTACGFVLAIGLAFEQHLHTPCQKGDVFVLAGDHLGEVIDGAGQVGDLSFEFFHGQRDRGHGPCGQATRRLA